jgi:hypothetical protein
MVIGYIALYFYGKMCADEKPKVTITAQELIIAADFILAGMNFARYLSEC